MKCYHVFQCWCNVDFDFFLALIFERIKLKFLPHFTEQADFFSHYIAPFSNVLNKPAAPRCDSGKSFFADIKERLFVLCCSLTFVYLLKSQKYLRIAPWKEMNNMDLFLDRKSNAFFINQFVCWTVKQLTTTLLLSCI